MMYCLTALHYKKNKVGWCKEVIVYYHHSCHINSKSVTLGKGVSISILQKTKLLKANICQGQDVSLPSGRVISWKAGAFSFLLFRFGFGLRATDPELFWNQVSGMTEQRCCPCLVTVRASHHGEGKRIFSKLWASSEGINRKGCKTHGHPDFLSGDYSKKAHMK